MEYSKFQVFSVSLVICLDIVDLIIDWLFYVEVSSAEQGLVYGRPKKGVVSALLAFSIIGTIAFPCEIINLGWKLRNNKPFVNIDLIAVLIVWIEDIPQLIISLIIASCREDPISVLQTTKACVILFGIVIRIILTVVRYCSQDCQNMKTCRCYRRLIMIGLFLSFVGAILVFIFTQSRKHDNGISFPVPSLEDRFHDDRYFTNVSIYFHHPTLDVHEHNNLKDANWMRLITINRARNLPNKGIILKYEYQGTSAERKMVLWENDDALQWKPTECYTITKGNMSLAEGSNCSSYLDNSNDSTSIIFKFVFIQPDWFPRKLFFGDIKFNALYLYNKSICEDIPAGNITIHYYQTHVGEEKHVIASDTLGIRFYGDKDLTDITEVWKTGWGNCEPNGNLAPRFDSNIKVTCGVI